MSTLTVRVMKNRHNGEPSHSGGDREDVISRGSVGSWIKSYGRERTTVKKNNKQAGSPGGACSSVRDFVHCYVLSFDECITVI